MSIGYGGGASRGAAVISTETMAFQLVFNSYLYASCRLPHEQWTSMRLTAVRERSCISLCPVVKLGLLLTWLGVQQTAQAGLGSLQQHVGHAEHVWRHLTLPEHRGTHRTRQSDVTLHRRNTEEHTEHVSPASPQHRGTHKTCQCGTLYTSGTHEEHAKHISPASLYTGGTHEEHTENVVSRA